MNKSHFSENKWLLFRNKRALFTNNQGLLTNYLTLTRHLTGWTALCSLLSGREQGSVEPTAGRRVTVSREGVGVCPLPKGWRFTSQGPIVCLLLVGGLLTACWQFAYWRTRLTPIARISFMQRKSGGVSVTITLPPTLHLTPHPRLNPFMHALTDFATKFQSYLGGVLGWVIGWVLGLLFQQHPPQWKPSIYWHSDKLGLLLVLFRALPREKIFPA